MKRVIITGATSMLGIALIDKCISQNIEIIALVRKNSIKVNRIPKSPLVTLIECDLENIRHLNIGSIGKCDTIYHLAWGDTSNLSRDNVVAHARNIEYTLDTVDLAKKLDCDTFIGAGSQAEYGRKDFIIHTNSECNPETAYGIAKYTAGKLSAIKCESLDVRHIWARIFSVYGPNNNSETMIMYCIRKLLSGEKPSLTRCEQIWDYLYCDDAATALFLLGEKGCNKKTYNIAFGKSEPLINYVKQIRDLIDINLDLEIGKIDYSKKQVMYLSADISELTKDTGFVPKTLFEEGIKETILWSRNNIMF
jgi:nucleoside-diphosphate-sugar epimerase